MIKSDAKELIKALAEGQAVDFSFIKKDGSLRKAIGTLKPELYLDNIPKGNGKERKGVVTFFDVTIGDWRSLRESTDIFINALYKKSGGFDCSKHIVSDDLANALFNTHKNL